MRESAKAVSDLSERSGELNEVIESLRKGDQLSRITSYNVCYTKLLRPAS